MVEFLTRRYWKNRRTEFTDYKKLFAREEKLLVIESSREVFI